MSLMSGCLCLRCPISFSLQGSSSRPVPADWCFMEDYVLPGFSALISWIPVPLPRSAISSCVFSHCLPACALIFSESVRRTLDGIVRKDTMYMLEKSIAARPEELGSLEEQCSGNG